jgi:hypothetical protein
MSSSKKSKYTFILKNINVENIEKKYDIKIVSNISGSFTEPENTTKISELSVDKENDIVSFLDESKKLHKCNVSMIDFNSKKELSFSNYSCFWCRHPFDTSAIGCPISYETNTAVKKYMSEISKDVYTIKENITKNRIIEAAKEINILNRNYYITDGIFCSFNCVMAFIEDNKFNRLYDNSIMLLTKMYNEIMNTKMISINPAPHWRLLSNYGGIMNINEFRSSFNTIDYDNYGHVKNISFKSIGVLYEKKLKF